MINPNTLRQPSYVIDVPQNTPLTIALIQGSVQLKDKIGERAYQLYESRGCQSGQDKQDWLRAEEEILSSADRPQLK